MGDCEADSPQLVKKIIPSEDFRSPLKKHRTQALSSVFGSGEVVTLESGPEVLMHKIGYRLTLLGSHEISKSVTISSPLVRFVPIKCSGFYLDLDEPFSVEQV